MIKLALKNPVAIAMFSLALIILGLVGLGRLPLDLFPKVDVPVIMVGTIYPGASPEVVERTVSYQIERAAAQTANLDYVSSQSRYGLSIVRAWYRWGSNIDAAELQVSQEVASILKTLPHGIFPPFVVAFDVSNIPVATVTLESEELDEKALYDLATNVIQPQLAALPGISYASPTGGKVREIVIRLNPDLMREHAVDAAAVEKAILDANFLSSSGDIRVGTLDYNVFANTQIKSVEELNDVVVKISGNTPIHVRDIGAAVDGSGIQVNIARLNGKKGLYLSVYRQPGTNTIEIVDALKKYVPELSGVPASVHMKVAFDQAKFVRASIEGLRHEGLQGAILAMLVVVFFLGSLRSTGIVFVALPLSVLATFFALYATGETLNAFTLGGLTLVASRIIDNAIVVLENIHRHLEEGEPPLVAAYEGAREVVLPVLASTITTVLVFVPVVMLEGVAKFLFTPMMVTMALGMAASFAVAVSVIPVLCRRFLKVSHAPKEATGWERILGAGPRIMDRVDAQYERLLGLVLRKKAIFSLAIGAAFVGSMALVPELGSEFFPEADESQFRVILRTPIGTRLEETERQIAEVEAITAQVIGKQAIKTMLSNVGTPRGSRSAFYSTNTGPHSAYLQVELVPPDQRTLSTTEYISKLRPALQSAMPGRAIAFDPGGAMKKVLNFGYSSPIDVELSGYDLKQAHEVAQKLAIAMQGVAGIRDVLISREENFPELDVKVDREKAALLGVSERDVARTLQDSLLGNYSSAPYFEDPRTGNEYFVVTRLDGAHASKLEDLGNITVVSARGAPVYLKSIAEIGRSSGPVQIDRRRMQRVIDLTANPQGRDLGAVSEEVRAAVAKVDLPPGFQVRLRGQTEQQEKTFASLQGATILALALVFMLLASQFKSLLQPFIIMTSVPLGLIGVVVALYFTGTRLSTSSFMGIIMMVGVAVSNGVLLIDFANVLRRRGTELEAAIVKAGRSRLRPILMTTLATLLGLIPMALGIGEGSEANAPLARAVIGGLGVSTILTLFFAPLVYVVVERTFGKAPNAEEERALELLGVSGGAS
ncbi:MAG: efflux RND transporter permease subunit [Myxococcota bacterium]